MFKQDLEPDQDENDAAGEFGAALVARADAIIMVSKHRRRSHMLTRLLETAANAADAAQTGRFGFA